MGPLWGCQPPGERLQLPAHKVEGRLQAGVVAVEPFRSDGFSFVIVHAGLDAVQARSVPLMIYTHLFNNDHCRGRTG
jgi:hypothetical protein